MRNSQKLILLALAFCIVAVTAVSAKKDNRPHVVVVGAGPAGLSTATHLAESGARVTLLEKNDRPGGMARDGIDKNGYMENCGWRIISDYYTYMRSVMSRMPSMFRNATNPNRMVVEDFTGLDHVRVLDTADRHELARFTAGEMGTMFGIFSKMSLGDLKHLAYLIALGSTCYDERCKSYHNIRVREMFAYDHRSQAYRDLMNGMMPVVTGMDPDHTGGDVILSTFEGFFFQYGVANKEGAGIYIPDGPWNSIVWDQWTKYLSSIGVDVRLNSRVTSLDPKFNIKDQKKTKSNGNVVGVKDTTDDDNHKNEFLDADFVVVASGPRIAGQLLHSAKLERLGRSQEQFLPGVVLHFDTHVIDNEVAGFWMASEIEAPWTPFMNPASTAWPSVQTFLGEKTNVKQVIAISACSPEKLGVVHHKIAREATMDEFVDEILAQTGLEEFRDHLVHVGLPVNHPIGGKNNRTMLFDPETDDVKVSSNAQTWEVTPDVMEYSQSHSTAIAGCYMPNHMAKYTSWCSMEGASHSGFIAANKVIGELQTRPEFSHIELGEHQKSGNNVGYTFNRYSNFLLSLFRNIDGVCWVLGLPPFIDIVPTLGIIAAATYALNVRFGRGKKVVA